MGLNLGFCAVCTLLLLLGMLRRVYGPRIQLLEIKSGQPSRCWLLRRVIVADIVEQCYRAYTLVLGSGYAPLTCDRSKYER